MRKMEKKNVVFTKDGAKVGVKEVRTEDYADRTQKAFVKTWNAAQEKAYVHLYSVPAELEEPEGPLSIGILASY